MKPEETIEIFTFMEAADESKRRGAEVRLSKSAERVVGRGFGATVTTCHNVEETEQSGEAGDLFQLRNAGPKGGKGPRRRAPCRGSLPRRLSWWRVRAIPGLVQLRLLGAITGQIIGNHRLLRKNVPRRAGGVRGFRTGPARFTAGRRRPMDPSGDFVRMQLNVALCDIKGRVPILSVCADGVLGVQHRRED